MSRIVFFNIPAHGHTNPTLGVVRELIGRGHEVWYYSFEEMRAKIEATGAVLVPCDEAGGQMQFAPGDASRVGKDLALSVRLLVDATLALDGRVFADMQRLMPDCIVADSMAMWGRAVALKLGVPFVSSTTTFAFNQHSAKIMKRSAADLIRMLLAMPKAQHQVRRLQRAGYPVRSILDIIANDNSTHTIVYTSPGFQPCAETFSDRFAFVGPLIRPAAGRVEKKREKLVYISMGTVNNDMTAFYRECLHALGNSPYQVILSVGDKVSIEALGPLAPNISVHAHVDQIAVLEQADVFVSHCGMNSVSESLYFGVPLVMSPQTDEQRGVASRVEQLGAGVMLHPAEELSDAVRRVLQDNAYREHAAQIGEGFRRCSGAAGAADKIEQVCRTE